LICPGTSAGLTLLFGALLERGDKVLLTDPYYSCYPNFVRFFGGKPVFLRLHGKNGFRPDPDEMRGVILKAGGVKAIVINSPANPTGAVLDPPVLRGIAEEEALIISDEIYHGLNYSGERDHTILEYTDNAVVVGGFSKSFAMTGWRVGHLVLPEDYVRPMRTLSQNFIISVNSAVQKAAVVALEKAWPEVERMRGIYDERRGILYRGLSSLGLGILSEPAGAFYILAKVSHVNPDSRALVFDLLEKAGVATTPGAEFGKGAEGFLRFSYAVSAEHIHEALRRLKDYLSERGFLPPGR
jgi:aspartate aminotransferase